MNWQRRHAKRGYHHGNLRAALIEAAMRLIAERGPEGVTLAEAARMAGVTPAAPYRHFKDRAMLMCAVAEIGFERFADRLQAAWNAGGKPVEALIRTGMGYLAFAREEPALYAAMFESGIPQNADPNLSKQGNRAFDILKDACTGVHATLPETRRAPPLMMALHIWAMAHGIASLFGRADASRRPVPVSPEELLEAGLLIYLDGLGLSDTAKAN